MVFSEDFLIELKNNPLDGTLLLVKRTRDNLYAGSTEWQEEEYQVLIEAYALVMEIIDSNLLSVTPPGFSITGNMGDDCMYINQYLKSLEEYCFSESAKLKLQSFRSHFKNSLGSGFCYEFSQGDLERVQQLINQLRELISQAKDLEKDHQRRLLTRLEKLQSELHKKVSDLDRFWGLVGDAGVVLEKLGKNAKPIVDRIKEIAEIVWQTQTRAEELPSGIKLPLLSNKSEPDEDNG